MKIYWWDSKGYGTWVFVLANSKEEAITQIRASALNADKERNIQRKALSDKLDDYWEREGQFLINLDSVEEYKPGDVVWGEWA